MREWMRGGDGICITCASGGGVKEGSWRVSDGGTELHLGFVHGQTTVATCQCVPGTTCTWDPVPVWLFACGVMRCSGSQDQAAALTLCILPQVGIVIEGANIPMNPNFGPERLHGLSYKDCLLDTPSITTHTTGITLFILFNDSLLDQLARQKNRNKMVAVDAHDSGRCY